MLPGAACTYGEQYTCEIPNIGEVIGNGRGIVECELAVELQAVCGCGYRFHFDRGAVFRGFLFRCACK